MPPPPQQGSGQQGGGSENHMAPMWTIIVIVVFACVLWVLAKGIIIKGFCYIKLFEINLLSFFESSPSLLIPSIHQMLENPGDTQFYQLITLANSVGGYLFIPVVIVLVTLAIVLYFRSVTYNYRQVHSMKTLLGIETKLWPQTYPIIGKNLVKQHVDKGPWAMAMTPMQFAVCYKLLEIETNKDDHIFNKKKEVKYTLKKDKVHQLLIEQLGEMWLGINQLKPHIKALFAVFVAHASRNDKVTRQLLNQLAISAHKGKLNFTGVDDIIKKYEDNKILKRLIDGHSYNLTVMASLLEHARTNGVLASADFIWLKPKDRRLWFMLNSVGRQTAPAEVAGPFSHWLAEKKAGHRIKVPMISSAILALEEALANIAYQEQEED